MDEQDKDYSMNFTFEYHTHGEDKSVRRSFEDGTSWHEVLREFNNFLSAVYGYRIDEIDCLIGAKEKGLA
jgi:hypothetical protein